MMNKYKICLIVIAFFSIAILFYEGILWDKDYYHFYGDGDYFLNFTANIVNASYLRQGLLPLWNQLSYGGFSAIGTDHYETNPLNPMVIFPYLFGMNSNTYFLLFFIIISFFSAYYYFRHALHFTQNISFIGAMIYANSIYPPTNMNDGLVFALFPLALYLVNKYFENNSFKMMIWFSIMMAIVFLNGFCHRFFDMLLLVSIYFFILAIKLKRNILRESCIFCSSSLIIAGLVAVTLFPQIYTAIFEVRRNRPFLYEQGWSFFQVMQSMASYIIVHFIVPFKNLYINFEDFSLKLSRILPLKPGPYLSILFIPAIIYLGLRRKSSLIYSIKKAKNNYLVIYFFILAFILLLPIDFIAIKCGLHEQIHYVFTYLQRYTHSIIQLFLIIPILLFLNRIEEKNTYVLPYKTVLCLLSLVVILLFLPFFGLMLGYLTYERGLLNFILSIYEKKKHLIPYELNYAFLKHVGDYFLRSPLTIFIISLFAVKLLLLNKLFSIRKISIFFILLISMDCVLAQKVYYVPHDDFRRLWVYKTKEKEFFHTLTFLDRIAVKKLARRLDGTWYNPEELKDLPQSFFKKDLAGIRRRAWFPDYRYRNPGYPQYAHAFFMVSAFQGLNHLLPKYLKEYMFEINSKTDPGKVDFLDQLIFDTDSHLIDVAGINYILSSLPLKKKGLDFLFKGRQYYVYKNKNAFNKAYFSQKYTLFSEKESSDEIFKYLSSMDDKDAVIITDEEIVNQNVNSNTDLEYSLDFVKYTPNEIILEVKTNTDGVLVLNDTYYPGWKVKVDGKEDKIYRANMAFRGVFLKPGSHYIEFKYYPIGFRSGIIVSSMTILLIAAFFLFKAKRTKVQK